MARKGGQTTFSGTKFQAEITALYLGRMLDLRARQSEDQVREVRPEADVEAEVDDILVRFQDGHTEYIQAKEKLDRSKSETSAWVKMWVHFRAQRQQADFREDDRIILALGQPQAWTDDLRSACETASESARDSREWHDQWLTQSQTALVEDVRKILFEQGPKEGQDEQLLALFGSITVRMYDPERIRADHAPHFMPQSDRDWSGLYDLLLRIVWDSAEKGKLIEARWLLEKLGKEGVRLYAPGEKGELPPLPEPEELPEAQEDLPPGSRLPFPRNHAFTGRRPDLHEMAAALFYSTPGTARRMALTGGGGLGKTQLAVEFCYRYGRFPYGVHWLDATQTMESQIAACGKAMKLMDSVEWEALDSPTQVKLTLSAWEQQSERLVVLDNLDDPGDLHRWLEDLKPYPLLVTSRRDDYEPEDGVMEYAVQTLPRPDSRALLRRLAQRLDNVADSDLDLLCNRLGDLPLALDLAGRYLDKEGIDIADYLDEIAEEESLLEHESFISEKLNRTTQHVRSLFATFHYSWKDLQEDKKKDKLARRLLLACGYCAANTPIPADLLRSALGLKAKAGGRTLQAVLELKGKAGGRKLKRALNRLYRLGLLTESAEGAVIHPLLGEFARALDGEAGKSALAGLADWLVELSGEALDTGIPAEFAPLRAHVAVAAEWAEEVGLKKAALLWNNLGLHMKDVAEYQGAREHYERALRIHEKAFGPKRPTMAVLVNNLGMVLKELGDLAGARAHFERALRIDEKAFGPEHPNVAIQVNNLGLVLMELGDLAGARAHFQRALRIDEKVFGPEHPDVARDVNNLGGVLQDLGDLEGAREHYERALRIDEKAFGPEHPEVATDVNNLGGVLKDLGDLERAREHYERALSIDEKAFGPEHPDVARVVNNLGHLYIELGNLEGARLQFERAMKILKKFLPVEHPYIISASESLNDVIMALKTQEFDSPASKDE